MIDVYTWTTPNGFKALIAVEELALPHTTHWINIGKGEQMTPEYLAINPNNKIPAIVDRETSQTVFESGALLIYLANKTKKLIGDKRYEVLEWVFFGAASTGPMMGQLGYFAKFAKEKVPPAIERYTKEGERLLKVLDGQLAKGRFLAGDYSIADIMNVTWSRAAGNFGIDLASYKHVTRWLEEIEARPAVKRALAMKPA